MFQEIASSPENSCIVLASAGSGKTKVLVDRFLNILKEGYDPESILCLTFTKTAAAEMKERIFHILKTTNNMLYQKICDLNLKIQTIHSFCQETLSQKNEFRIIDDIESKHYLKRAKKKVYKNCKEDITFLAQKISYNAFNDLLDYLIAQPFLFLNWKKNHQNTKEYYAYLKKVLDYEKTNNSSFLDEDYKACLTQKGELRTNIPPDYKEIAPNILAKYIDQTHKEITEITLHFLNIAETVFNIYKQIKKEENVLDFYDLLTCIHTDHLKDLNLSHVLIDEAQDTSPIQWELIKKIVDLHIINKKGHTLFIVGDPKQSIYSFQGANPKVFEEISNYFEQKIPDLKRISFIKSYRTNQKILDCVDQTFRFFGAKFSSHISARKDMGFVKVLPLTEKIKPDIPNWGLIEENHTQNRSSKEQHAYNTGHFIASLLNSQKVLPSTKKKIQPSDILVLFQKRSNLLSELENVLSEFNIPCSGHDRIILYDQLIVKDLLACAHFALLPFDDYNLACLLKSPFINCSEEELYDLCSNRLSSLFKYLNKIDHRCIPFLEDLILKKNTSPFDFFYPIIQDMAFGDSQILNAFMEIIYDFEQNNIPSLREFIHWIKNSNNSLKKNATHCVRFMTIHASKGLQAPIVILADSTEKPSLRQDLFLIQDHIFLIKTTHETPFTKSIKKNMLSQLNAEHLRLLYVAMTRAQDFLYLTGEDKNDIWYSAIKPFAEFCDLSIVSDYFFSTQKPEIKRLNFITPYTEEEKSIERKKGIEIHKELESLPYITPDSPHKKKIELLLMKFPDFFTGEAEKMIWTPFGIKRFDRYIEKENEVWIVEYKTHENKPKNINGIIEQMKEYHKALSHFKENIRCFILWVMIEEVEEIYL